MANFEFKILKFTINTIYRLLKFTYQNQNLTIKLLKI